jgi:colicin import membrane protein
MRGPSLQKTALLSFALHLTVFAIAFIILRQASRIVLPPPYTVNLVSPDVLTGSDRGTVTAGPVSKETTESREPAAPAEMPKKNKKEAAKEKEMIEKRIADLRQSERIRKKIEAIQEKNNEIRKLAGLRKVISLKARGDKLNTVARKAVSASASRGSASDDYYAKITREIWQRWVYPDVGRKDIEAIISIRILKDGTAIVEKVEKSSGNALFDRSAVRAIAKANPLFPPPYEMEIGVRFYP